MSETGRVPSRRRRLLAIAEVLRAPLLLSPVADVLGGATLATAAWAGQTQPSHGSLPWYEITFAAAAGIALLAAGMAENALVDLDADRRDKPDRPLPRGAISTRAVRRLRVTAVAAGLLGAGIVSPAAFGLAVAITVLTTVYHRSKHRRLPGCLILGGLRALDMALGIAAAAAALFPDQTPELSGSVCMVPLLYGLYITGAALHASTDDQPVTPVTQTWSRGGVATAAAALIVLGLAGVRWPSPVQGMYARTATAAGLITLVALGRLIHASFARPRPVVTGVVLSGLYLFQAAVAVHLGGSIGVCIGILLAFAASRLMLRAFPPS